MADVVAVPTLDALSGFVHRALCEPDALDPAQSPLFATRLVRAGRSCGLLFHVEGPRRLRPSAIWAADEGRVLFYDAAGQRVREVRLSEGPAEVRNAEFGMRNSGHTDEARAA